MSMQIGDPIRSAVSRGSAQEALLGLDYPDAKDAAYVNTMYERAPDVSIDASIGVNQCFEETAGLTSYRWIHDTGPAGIGIVFDDTAQPFVIPTPQAAAI